MDNVTLKRIRPTSNSAAAIRASLELVAEERRASERRLADCAAARSGLLLDGTTAQIREADTAIRDAQTDLQQFDLMAEELRRRLIEAAAREAGEARAQQVRDAAAKIEAFNMWLATVYTTHARAIAEGVELERIALRGIQCLRDPATNAPAAELPPLAKAFVRNDARGLGFLVRLPAAEPGPAIVWP